MGPGVAPAPAGLYKFSAAEIRSADKQLCASRLEYIADICDPCIRSPEAESKEEVDHPAAAEPEAEEDTVGIEGIATLEASLRPVEKYAVRWVEQVNYIPIRKLIVFESDHHPWQ